MLGVALDRDHVYGLRFVRVDVDPQTLKSVGKLPLTSCRGVASIVTCRLTSQCFSA